MLQMVQEKKGIESRRGKFHAIVMNCPDKMKFVKFLVSTPIVRGFGLRSYLEKTKEKGRNGKEDLHSSYLGFLHVF